MTNNDEIWAVIARVLEGSPIPGDLEILEKWQRKDPVNERVFQEAQNVWSQSHANAERNLKNYSYADQDWQKVAVRIRKPSQIIPQKDRKGYQEIKRKGRVASVLSKAAAVLLVAASSAFLTIQYTSATDSQQIEIVYNEFRTAPGEKASIQLSDGSEASLSADTGLSVPNFFQQDKREVVLDGHAFFDVKKDPARPFLIHTSDGIIEVLGTSFDVRAYSDEENIDVVVRNGVVQLRHSVNPENNAIVNAGYRGRITQGGEAIFVEWADNIEDHFGWLDGRLVFKEQSLSNVFRQLERWYNINIQVSDLHPEILEKEFTADLKTRSVIDVMDLIGFTMGVQYSLDEDQVFITLADSQ